MNILKSYKIKNILFKNNKMDNNAQLVTAGYSPCRKSRFYKNMNGKIKDVTL